MNATLAALAEASEERYRRKRLIASTLGEGREVLHALARARPWIGFEPLTPWILATELAAGTLAASLRVIDEFEQLALLDEAMDFAAREAGDFAAALADRPGLRQAVAEAVREMRHTGVDAALLVRTPLRDTARRDALARVLRRYEAALHRASAIDAAGVFRAALQAVDTGTAEPAAAHYLVLPGVDRRGLAGRLVQRLVDRGATVLPTDPVHGLERPEAVFAGDSAGPAGTRLSFVHDPASAPAFEHDLALDVFAAASVTDELREVLRRVVAADLAWDEVEIVASDPVGYGTALDALARRLGIDVAYGAGLPVARTRPGRAIHAYLQWVREDLPADGIRAMLERGDLEPERADVSGVALARRLRALRVGRSRDRWAAAVAAALRGLDRPADRDDNRPPEEIEASRARERTEVEALTSILAPILDATPDVPDHLRTHDVPVAPGALARGLLTMLRFVPTPNPVDATAKLRLEKRLERMAATLVRPIGIDAAVALLEARLDSRVPAPDEGGAAPWSASGGRLYLSDLRHGGWTGRRATFVVGLDAGRFPPGGVQEAVLSDDDRRRLTTGQDIPAMPTSMDRVREARWGLATLLARLRGRVTLSWSAWEAAEARSLAPAPEVLQTHRLATGDATRDYRALQSAAGIASPVPAADAAALDAQDVWLAAIAEGGVMRDGEAVVRAAFPALDRGLTAAAARSGQAYTAYHGHVAKRAALEARGHASLILSATRLEDLGTCPLRYFLRTVLRVRAPDDVELDPDRWLSPLQRGGLLHAVYEAALVIARQRDVAYDDVAFAEIAQRVLDEQIEEYRALQPPPGGAVFRQEIEALRGDVRAFVAMIRDDAPDWIDVELAFGRGGRPPFDLALPDGTVRLAGAIDRVDRLPDGRLRVVDYKTGSSYRYRQGDDYHGARRLQHVLYAAVARSVLGKDVAHVEYHFPTVRELKDRTRYSGHVLAGGLDVVNDLLDIAASGRFHPTDDPGDCRFCDYAAACRVTLVRGKPQSPAADWMKEAPDHEALRTLRRLRQS